MKKPQEEMKQPQDEICMARQNHYTIGRELFISNQVLLRQESLKQPQDEDEPYQAAQAEPQYQYLDKPVSPKSNLIRLQPLANRKPGKTFKVSPTKIRLS